MDAVDPALKEQYPNLAMAPADLVKHEQLRDVGPAQKAYARAVTEIMSAK
jgi:spermidine/putrescine transport system substrate-binding protein